MLIDMEGTVPLPATIEEVEELIRALYKPANPSSIASTQAILQTLQKSAGGWELARQLLARDDQNVKFFGALTIIIKLNTEGSSLVPDDVNGLLLALIGRLLQSLGDGSGSLVIRKLIAALVTLFLQFPRIWQRSVYHLSYCLASGQPCLPDAADQSVDPVGLMSGLEPAAKQAVLWFATAVAEDAAKIDLASPIHAGLYQSILSAITDAATLIRQELTSRLGEDGSGRYTTGYNSIKCFQAWVLFAQRVSGRDFSFLAVLRPLARPAIESIFVEERYEASVETITDILSNYSTFLQPEHHDLLHAVFETEWSRVKYNHLTTDPDPDFESVQFGQLLLAFGDSTLHSLMEVNDDRSTKILAALTGLLEARGIPVLEDKIFVPAVEFWASFTSDLTDSMFTAREEPLPWVPSALEHVRRAVSLVWRKIPYPPSETVGLWDSADRAGFSEARKDVADLLQSAFAILGPELLRTFADATLHAFSTASWMDLEALAFCLGSLAECLNGLDEDDDMLDRVFCPAFFEALHPSRQEMPARTRQTCATLIERYAEYFERQPRLLRPGLSLLFDILGNPHMAGTASKSIHQLCSSGRAHLGEDVDALLAMYGSVAASSHSLDCLAAERILGAIATVIQPLDRGYQSDSAVGRLLDFISLDMGRSLDLVRGAGAGAAPAPAPVGIEVEAICGRSDRCHLAGSGSGSHAGALHIALRALRCLASVGRGLQTPAEVPIDLDSEGQLGQVVSPTTRQLQARIVSLMTRARYAFPASGEIVEAICAVLRTGFSETEQGLFVLPADEVCEYLCSHSLDVPRIGAVVSTACSFISSAGTASASSFGPITERMLTWAITLLRSLPLHDTDTELTQNSIEFVTRLSYKNPAIFRTVPSDMLEFFLLFSLSVLEGREPLPKSAAADFWVHFIVLRSEDANLQKWLDDTMVAIGPSLTKSLMRNIGGNAARSELNKLSEPLRRLVVRHPKVSQWLEAAVCDPSFPGGSASAADKSMFIKRILMLRGAMPTNQAVRDFWILSRGSNFAYVD